MSLYRERKRSETRPVSSSCKTDRRKKWNFHYRIRKAQNGNSVTQRNKWFRS